VVRGWITSALPRDRDVEIRRHIERSRLRVGKEPKRTPIDRFEWNGFVDGVDQAKDSRRYMVGFNCYVLQQNFKITGAYERIVPNVASAGSSSKNTNHFVLQLQLFYF
jgi:hypothetical protein